MGVSDKKLNGVLLMFINLLVGNSELLVLVICLVLMCSRVFFILLLLFKVKYVCWVKFNGVFLFVVVESLSESLLLLFNV